MKPSERIAELADEKWNEFKQGIGAGSEFDQEQRLRETILPRAILVYLDEEHERREATRSHFTIIVTPGGNDARKPEEIAKAIQAAVEGVLDGVAQ